MELKENVIFDSGNEYGVISVKKEVYFEFEEKKQVVKNERLSFNPTQLSELKGFAPSLALVCSAMWTPAVIKRWEDYQKEQQELGL